MRYQSESGKDHQKEKERVKKRCHRESEIFGEGEGKNLVEDEKRPEAHDGKCDLEEIVYPSRPVECEDQVPHDLNRCGQQQCRQCPFEIGCENRYFEPWE